MRLTRILFIPDTHVPYHSKSAFGLMLRAAKVFRPDRVIVLGDFADFFCVSAHDKDPRRKLGLRDEVVDVNKCLDRIETLGADRYDFVQGNHEYRLERYLMSKAPELFDLVSVRDLFKLKDRGWSYTPYMSDLRVGKLHVTHECGNAGAQAHTKARSDFESNVVIGHTHRLAMSYQGNAQGVPHVGAMFGWLGDPDQVDYMHRVKARQWQHAFGTGYMEPNGVVHLQGHPIINGRVLMHGELVS